MDKRRILVTGGAGYIGSHTVNKLLDAGHDVVVYDNLSTGDKRSIPEIAPLVIGDIRNREDIEKCMSQHNIDSVFHFAGKIIVPESVRIPLEYYDINVSGTVSLLSACAAKKIQYFIFSSSAAVYGDVKTSPVSEAESIKPINPYGRTKAMGEEMIRDFGASYHQMKFALLRYFNVCGASVDGHNGPRSLNATSLVRVAAQVAAGKRDALEIFGTDYSTRDGTCIRDYIHVEDLANAHVAAYKYLLAGGNCECLNVGYGKGYSVLEIAHAMQKFSGKDFTITTGPRRPGDPPDVIADNTKIRTLTRWRPKYDNLTEICQTAYNWEVQLNSHSVETAHGK